MKRILLALPLVLGLAGCGDDKAALETTINAALANQMTVSEVNMTADASGNYSGYAKGKTKDGGLSATRNCTATRQGSEFAWKCIPGIDEDMIKSVTDAATKGLSEKGEVVAVNFKKGDDEDHMVGDATVNVDGQEVTAKCTAERDPPKTGADFKWNCE